MNTMCQNCMHLWFATPEQRTCPYCGEACVLAGMDAKSLAQWLSREGHTEAVMRAMVELYGLELRMTDDVRHTVELVPSVEAQLGQRIAHTIAKANIGQSDAWWMYNCTFRFLNDKAEVAIDGLARCNDASKCRICKVEPCEPGFDNCGGPNCIPY